MLQHLELVIILYIALPLDICTLSNQLSARYSRAAISVLSICYIFKGESKMKLRFLFAGALLASTFHATAAQCWPDPKGTGYTCCVTENGFNGGVYCDPATGPD